MAKKTPKNGLNVSQIQKDFNEKGKQYKEGDLIFMFNLNRTKTPTPLMAEWLSAPLPIFDAFEQQLFDRKLDDAITNITSWSEED